MKVGLLYIYNKCIYQAKNILATTYHWWSYNQIIDINACMTQGKACCCNTSRQKSAIILYYSNIHIYLGLGKLVLDKREDSDLI